VPSTTFPISDRKWHDDIVRVLVCDESALFRRRMVIALEADSRIEVVAEAPDSDVARGAALQHAPDVAVVASGLPPLGGDRTTLALRETNPGLRVVFVYDDLGADNGGGGDGDGHGDDADRSATALRRALRAGAQALVARPDAIDLVVDRSLALGLGRPVLEPVLARSLLTESGDDRATMTLVTRERSVLEAIAEGATIDDAAATIGVSSHTVENLVANALARLQRVARAEGRARLRAMRATDT
jgi:DNA-binding NarL/FixJ family response regulator